MQPPQMRPALTFFDLTNITVGSIIGADIYVASALTASMLGPASLLAWVVAGVLATTLALTLAGCSTFVPRVGGPYAYVAEAFGSFAGFVAGWSMWVAEVLALPVFAITFTNYLGYFVDLGQPARIALRAAFLAVLTGVNVAGVKAAGRLNDVLTLAKLTPLLLLVVVGAGYLLAHNDVARANYLPFAPHGLGAFSGALVLIFWAYQGFELTTVPAAEVQNPARTIPRAIATGMAIVAVFYLSTNVVVYGTVHWSELAKTATPLVTVSAVLAGSAGATVMAAGALLSVSGSDDSDMLASARLSYAMAVDGLLPRPLARLHPRFETPYVALIAQGVVAFALATWNRIPDLISFAVFNLSLTFMLSSAALWRLARRSPQPGRRARLRALAAAGVATAALLMGSTEWNDRLAGVAVLVAGAAIYAAFAPRELLAEARAALLADAALVGHALARRERFLAHWLMLVVRAARRLARARRARRGA